MTAFSRGLCLPLRLIAAFGLGLSVGLIACQGGQRVHESSGRDSASATGAARVDSMGDSLPPAPAPGTAHVRGTVASCAELNEPKTPRALRCKLRIDKVLKYGSATPVLSPSLLNVGVTGSYAEQWTEERLKEVGTGIFVLRHGGEQMQTDGAQTNAPQAPLPSWIVVSVSRIPEKKEK